MMNTFFIFILIIITLADCIIKFKVLDNGGELNIIVETAIEKLGWPGYIAMIIVILGIISLIDSILLNLTLITIMTVVLLGHIKILQQYRVR